uniref:Uncharacterized protein n=1 Tax=Hucho hucho TaxID=62062 RepID=A0A4W5JBK2_9TELE
MLLCFGFSFLPWKNKYYDTGIIPALLSCTIPRKLWEGCMQNNHRTATVSSSSKKHMALKKLCASWVCFILYDFVSILDLKSKRFLCVDVKEKWFSSVGIACCVSCLFQHRRMENHVDVFYSSRNGLLLLLEGAEIPVKGYDLLKRHMVYRRKRSQQENPDAESIMEDQDLAMQQDQEHAGAISKETITSCDDPLRVLHSNSPGSPIKMAVQKADKVAQGGLAV